MEKTSIKSFVMNILNGLALGIIVILIPGALFGELFKALVPHVSSLSLALQLIPATNSLMGFAVGIAIGYLFKLSPIESLSIGMATMIAGGAIQFVDNAVVLKGTGDIITMIFTASIAVLLVLCLRRYVGGYAILIIPPVVLFVSGILGRLASPYFVAITTELGKIIANLLTLEQTVMAVLLSVIFAFLIVSPISTVGIALAIQLAGIGSGAANLGICACAFSLAVAGRRVNSLGTCLAHFIGSPKMSMANVLAKPRLLVPIFLNAAIVGVLASIFAIKGTPLSAGFGISGLVGPVNHLNEAGWSLNNILVAAIVFVVVPVVMAFVLDYIFVDKLKWISADSYKITMK